MSGPEAGALRCAACNATYPIEDGVPVFVSRSAPGWDPKLAYEEPAATGLRARLRGVAALRSLVHWYRDLCRFLHLPSDWAPGPHIARMVEAHVSARPGQTALDVGGGSSYYRAAFAAKGCELFALDIHRYAGVDVIGSAFALPVLEGTVDVACLFQVLEHLYDPQTALRECFRVLSPGGVLLLTAPQFSHIHGWPSDYFRYTCYGLRHLAATAGFEVVEQRPMGGRFSVVVCAIGNCFDMGAGPLRYAPFSLMSYAAYRLDRLFDARNLASANPDTVGWAFCLRKPALR